MDVEAIRSQIPACQRVTYLNTGWQGPSPVSVSEAIKNRLDHESSLGPITKEVHESGRAIQRDVREMIAQLLNATYDEIALTQNTTDGLNIVLNGLDWHEGDEVITCGLEHSSVLVPSYVLRERHRVVVKVLDLAPAEDHASILDKFEQAITPRTRMVFISHVQFSTGLRMPVEGIRQLTRDRGIMMLLDAAQGTGHIAPDVRKIDCEFYSSSGQKWLLGPGGTGALYIRADMIAGLKPSRVSGHAAHSHDWQGAFEPNVDSIEKFHLTTSSNALWAGLAAAVRFNLDAGPADTEERVLSLAALLKGELAQIPGVTIFSPLEGPGCSGLVSMRMEDFDEHAIVDHLWENHNVVARTVSYPKGVRFSTCYFNTEEDLRIAAGAVRELAK